ncbi:MAG: cytochrome c-type biogenesis CcmF C-terminal domain-containing protein, partial [Pseudomonadota bacterium]
FNLAFTPFMVGLAILLPVGSVIPWKRARVAPTVKRLVPVMVVCLAVAGLAYAVQTGQSLIGPIGVALGVWLVTGVLVELWQRSAGHIARLFRLPRADWGKALAHAGLGITFIGVAGLTAWQQEDIVALAPGEATSVGHYTVTLQSVDDITGPNYVSTMATLTVQRDGQGPVFTLTPERRYYPVAAMPTTEAAIRNAVIDDVYIVIGDQQSDGRWAIRSFIKPFANWIWFGCILMALGGIVSLTDRRYRIAAGARRA